MVDIILVIYALMHMMLCEIESIFYHMIFMLYIGSCLCIINLKCRNIFIIFEFDIA